ncbi:MAG: hypothetical protein A3K19_32360 [Lentisphaerae bacterium RIFOXYB12_FULL_65_16]|nr:MAG: hypothetical protein A3K18_23140 [Lentisphaerae bacterium RIFOXYA12_64_32]OGV85713.1 MAG: hypothetical protein A3K19_32360 [Lentisphaerae bacterium RIFOXYB12_FULL_65_16]
MAEAFTIAEASVPTSDKPLSGSKLLVGWGLLALTMAVSVAIGLFVARTLFRAPQPGPETAAANPVVVIVICLLVGVVFLGGGLVAYLLILVTHCLTFNFTRPVFRTGFTTRLWLANVFVPLLLLGGVGFLVAVPVTALLLAAGLSAGLALGVPFFSVVIAGQFFLAWFSVWAPIQKSLIRKRLTALGVTPEQLAAGVYVGVSDPSVSSMKKLAQIEDDVGMLWFGPETLVYQGDVQRLDIRRDQFLEIERRLDKGSMAAYAGAVHVILRWRDDQGQEHRTRLHVEDCWTLTSMARGLNQLAARLQQWQAEPSTPPPPIPAPSTGEAATASEGLGSAG